MDPVKSHKPLNGKSLLWQKSRRNGGKEDMIKKIPGMRKIKHPIAGSEEEEPTCRERPEGLRADSRWHSARKQAPQSCRQMEALGSSPNLNELGSACSPRASRKEHSPAHPLILAL